MIRATLEIARARLTPDRFLAAALVAGGLLAVTLFNAGCQPVPSTASTEPPAQRESGREQSVELATLMGEMQRHSAKLGYAIRGKNAPLAQFYLEEIGEVSAELALVESHDGLPIAQTQQIIFAPALAAMPAPITLSELPAAATAYGALIEACNRCHAATQHEFIVIEQATGEPPYNQDFAAR